jgi:hypothetical protein
MARSIENDLTRLDWLDGDRLIRITRSSHPLESLGEMGRAWDGIRRELTFVDRSRLCVLIDTRAAPGRNDPEFERAFAPIRAEITRGFLRCAVLVRMSVSRLQVQRHANADGNDVRVFTDEAEAVAWLRRGLAGELIDAGSAK